ncbi:MAG: AmmeMemoRadiSam system protein B [Thermosipho sp. (in: Bacteria)]|nr:AmmeMemoRadiSam system protein B [Thermosipho sp. (in: thermotogales)]
MLRKALYAGKFYPESRDEIEDFIKYFSIFQTFENNEYYEKRGLILPHAGYVFSGKTAIKAVERVRNEGIPETIIIFGTNHTGYGNGICSVWDKGEWETPLGAISVDTEIASLFLEFSEIFVADYSAHLYEHSIEVQLPILKYFFNEFKIVPIIYNFQSVSNTFKILEVLSNMKFEKVLFVASSDFNHYDDEKTTLEKDEILIAKILKKEIEGMFKVAREQHITACGIGPMSILVGLFDNIELVDHTTSAEFSGDVSYTVGYASFILR